MTEADDEQGR